MALTGVSANRLELLQIADAVAREKAIDRSIVITAMEDAIAKAARSRYGAETDVHADINPTRIVPKGPELANWLTPHGRDALGGKPFGDGTPPGPPLAGEQVPAGHGA